MKFFHVLTLFPDLFPGPLGVSIFENARKKGIWDLKAWDLREYGFGPRKIVDDSPFGGGPGMIIRPDIVEKAVNSSRALGARKIFLSPRGRVFDQKFAEEMASQSEPLLLLCGRYEGVDQRAIDYLNFEEISIGNYVLAGGEVAAFVLMEAIIRKIPGVVGNEASFHKESFSDGLISEDRYTRPRVWKTTSGDEISVEEVLLSGDHKKIAHWQESKRKSIITKK